MMDVKDSEALRELTIDELEDVSGGGTGGCSCCGSSFNFRYFVFLAKSYFGS
jgi:hypothetical protein